MKVYIDGEWPDEADAKISVFDHGLLYGDGVFEGIRFYAGNVFRLDEHLERLYDSAKAILLEIPLTIDEMREATLETIRRNELRDGYIRLVVTRGVGTLGLSPFNCKPSVIIIAANIALYAEECYTKGLVVVTCGTRRPSPAALSPSIKSLNYLNNIMAKIEAINAGATEGLMLNEEGLVAECTGDNVFYARKGTIYTPPNYAGSLPGITRGVIFELAAKLGIPIIEREMTRYDIYTCDEAFLTGTAAEVIPMVMLDRRHLGTGAPGEITLKLMAAFHDLTRSSGVPIYP